MSPLEVVGFIFGIIGVYLTLKEQVWCFPIGIINVTLSLFLFWQQKLFADAFQQFIYIILLSYGWYKWINKSNSNNQTTIQHIPLKIFLKATVLTILFSITLALYLANYTEASFPWIDSFATGFSFLAQWMIARKYLENWLVWIPVNITYILVYWYKDLPLYLILFVVYLCLAIYGYQQWKKMFQTIKS
jgi:nicotinamide mononucleotide transporter